MPYRAQMGGIFGSGLYPKQPPAGNAGDIIDAVTRGATTLIGGAYARHQAQREQERQDAELELAKRTADRADSHDAFERTRAVSEDARKDRDEERKNRDQERQDFEAGYTPKRTTTKDVVEPGKVETNGAFGKPGKITGPKIKQEKATIPSAYDFAASKTGRTKQLEVDIDKTKRQERLKDAETLINYREKKRGERPGGGRTTDSPVVHAGAQVRSQISETTNRINRLQTEREKLAPETIEADQERADAIDAELKPLLARGDSLRSVGDEIGGKLTQDAGLGGTRGNTIRSAYTGTKLKPNGSTIRGGGEAAGGVPHPAAAKKVDGSTVRHPSKQVITRAEAQALQQQGFDSTAIARKYIVQ